MGLLLSGFFAFSIFVFYCLAKRFRERVPRPLRCKPDESFAEAQLIVTGTFRVYSWFAWIRLALFLADLAMLMLGRSLLHPGKGYALLEILVLVSQALLANALYWRLGFGHERIAYVLCHLAGIFVYEEVLFTMHRDLFPHLLKQDQTTST